MVWRKTGRGIGLLSSFGPRSSLVLEPSTKEGQLRVARGEEKGREARRGRAQSGAGTQRTVHNHSSALGLEPSGQLVLLTSVTLWPGKTEKVISDGEEWICTVGNAFSHSPISPAGDPARIAMRTARERVFEGQRERKES